MLVKIETKQAMSEVALIKKMMEDSRKIYINNGIHYIFWGVLVTVALLTNYLLLLTKTAGKYVGLMWLILMVCGGIIDGFIGRRQEKQAKAHTFAGNVLGSLWMASGISMFIFGFFGTISGAYNPIFVCPVISTSLGLSYYTSGVLQQIKWLQYISIGWWIGGALLFIFPSIHTLLIFAIMIICFQIIPGMILSSKAKQEQESEAPII